MRQNGSYSAPEGNSAAAQRAKRVTSSRIAAVHKVRHRHRVRRTRRDIGRGSHVLLASSSGGGCLRGRERRKQHPLKCLGVDTGACRGTAAKRCRRGAPECLVKRNGTKTKARQQNSYTLHWCGHVAWCEPRTRPALRLQRCSDRQRLRACASYAKSLKSAADAPPLPPRRSECCAACVVLGPT